MSHSLFFFLPVLSALEATEVRQCYQSQPYLTTTFSTSAASVSLSHLPIACLTLLPSMSPCRCCSNFQSQTILTCKPSDPAKPHMIICCALPVSEAPSLFLPCLPSIYLTFSLIFFSPSALSRFFFSPTVIFPLTSYPLSISLSPPSFGALPLLGRRSHFQPEQCSIEAF